MRKANKAWFTRPVTAAAYMVGNDECVLLAMNKPALCRILEHLKSPNDPAKFKRVTMVPAKKGGAK